MNLPELLALVVVCVLNVALIPGSGYPAVHFFLAVVSALLAIGFSRGARGEHDTG